MMIKIKDTKSRHWLKKIEALKKMMGTINAQHRKETERTKEIKTEIHHIESTHNRLNKREDRISDLEDRIAANNHKNIS